MLSRVWLGLTTTDPQPESSMATTCPHTADIAHAARRTACGYGLEKEMASTSPSAGNLPT